MTSSRKVVLFFLILLTTGFFSCKTFNVQKRLYNKGFYFSSRYILDKTSSTLNNISKNIGTDLIASNKQNLSCAIINKKLIESINYLEAPIDTPPKNNKSNLFNQNITYLEIKKNKVPCEDCKKKCSKYLEKYRYYDRLFHKTDSNFYKEKKIQYYQEYLECYKKYQDIQNKQKDIFDTLTYKEPDTYYKKDCEGYYKARDYYKKLRDSSYTDANNKKYYYFYKKCERCTYNKEASKGKTGEVIGFILLMIVLLGFIILGFVLTYKLLGLLPMLISIACLLAAIIGIYIVLNSLGSL